jgi:hypothetical protein
MLVPEPWTDGLRLLHATPAGNALLLSAELGGAQASIDPTLRAHGKAVSPVQIYVRQEPLSPCIQACVLAHELTHCLDFVHWKYKNAGSFKTIELAMSEINAHYNQGLIARQIAEKFPDEKSVQEMIGSNATFGRMYSAKDRPAVAYELRDTEQYGDAVRQLIETKVLYLWIRDDQWEAMGEEFHCEAHLAKNNYGGFGA